MSPGLFLNIAENTGDSFPYEILPVKDVLEIPLRHHNPIVRKIVRPRDLDCSSASIVRKKNHYFTFWNSNGEELFSEE